MASSEDQEKEITLNPLVSTLNLIIIALGWGHQK